MYKHPSEFHFWIKRQTDLANSPWWLVGLRSLFRIGVIRFQKGPPRFFAHESTMSWPPMASIQKVSLSKHSRYGGGAYNYIFAYTCIYIYTYVYYVNICIIYIYMYSYLYNTFTCGELNYGTSPVDERADWQHFGPGRKWLGGCCVEVVVESDLTLRLYMAVDQKMVQPLTTGPLNTRYDPFCHSHKKKKKQQQSLPCS